VPCKRDSQHGGAGETLTNFIRGRSDTSLWRGADSTTVQCKAHSYMEDDGISER